MANADLDTAFEGLDSAKSVDRYPKLAPNGEYLLEVVRTEVIEGFKAGTTLVVENKCIESSVPEVLPGHIYSVTITGLDKKANRHIKLGKVKALVAALFNQDQNSDQKWLQIAKYMCQKQAAFGFRFKVQTGPKTKTDDGFEYVPHMCFPAPADKLAANQPKAK